MLIKKLLLALVCALTLCAAWLRPVCAVYMPESREGGSCEAAELAEVLRSARAAADEVARGGTEAPELRLSWRLSLRPQTDAAGLARALTAGYSGVDELWEVSAGGEDVGRTGDPSALGEVLLAAIAEAAPPESLRTGFTGEISLRPVLVPEGEKPDLTELSARLRGAVQVFYTTPDGETVYA